MVLRHLILGVTVAATFMVAAPVQAQARTSLADRVARLEAQQAQADAGQAVDMVNQITDLRAELQALRGEVERLQHENEQLRQRMREQYLDLDGRLNRIEGAPADDEAGSIDEAPVATTGGPVAPVATPPGREPAPASPQDALSERDAYEAAFDSLKNGRYAESARRFQAFTTEFPDSDYAPNAWYWLGESYYVTQNYEVALDSFRALLERFPDSAKAPDALLKLGYAQYELRRWDDAEATLREVMDRYPDSSVARLAQGRLRALALDRSR